MAETTEMTTHDALLAAVLAAPDDDLPRLVYADWLEENTGEVACLACSGTGYKMPSSSTLPTPTESRDANGRVVYTQKMESFLWKMPKCPACSGSKVTSNGNAERAEFIRVQCELARIRKKNFDRIQSGGPMLTQEESAAVPVLTERERKLYSAHWYEWLPQKWDVAQFSYRRGFVSEVRCTLADWCGGEAACDWCDGSGTVRRADAAGDMDDETCPRCGGSRISRVIRTPGIGRTVVRSHPVTRVVLTDREPSQYTGVGIRGDSWYWCTAYGDTLHFADRIPAAVAAFLVGCFRERDGVYQYHTREAAWNALSAACIAWAKSTLI